MELIVLIFSIPTRYECTERHWSDQCDYNYHLKNNQCIPCPPGYFGKKCLSICPLGFYGDLCTYNCTKCDVSECHHIHGCQRSEISTPETSPKRIGTQSSTFDKEISTVTRNQNRATFTTENNSLLTFNSMSISIGLTTPHVIGEKNNINTTIIVVGGMITLCLVILIIQVGYKQIWQYKRKHVQLPAEQAQTEETYTEINDGFLNSTGSKHESLITKKKNKYNTIIHVPEISSREYQDIPENTLISDQKENSSTSTAHSGRSEDSYLMPNEDVPLHTYSDVIDVSPSSKKKSADYLDPVLELSPCIHTSEKNNPKHDTVEPLSHLNVTDNSENPYSDDVSSTNMYLDAVNL